MRCYTALTAAAAALMLLLLVPLAAEAEDRSIAPYRGRSETETRRMFVKWMAKHGKAYHSAVEEERRYVVFKGKLRLVEQHNAAADAGVYPYRLGLNQYSDRTSTEICCRARP